MTFCTFVGPAGEIIAKIGSLFDRINLLLSPSYKLVKYKTRLKGMLWIKSPK